jgi:hypothetical protein
VTAPFLRTETLAGKLRKDSEWRAPLKSAPANPFWEFPCFRQ